MKAIISYGENGNIRKITVIPAQIADNIELLPEVGEYSLKVDAAQLGITISPESDYDAFHRQMEVARQGLCVRDERLVKRIPVRSD